ncbi:MAG: mechanosensitive ion channel [Weeksellaceae bacterium]|nr:mechanosensitive ion channel [Weeksellaceae bacterium]
MDITNIQVQSEVYTWLFEKLLNSGLSEKMAHSVNSVLVIIFLAIVLYVVDYVSRWILRSIIVRAVRKTKTKFDDYLIENKVIKYFMHIVTIIIAKLFLPLIFLGLPKWINVTMKFTDVVMIITVGLFANGIIKSVRDWLKTKKAFQDKPIDSYAQVITLLVFFVCGIIIFSSLTGKSPYAFLVSLGAASAILMLIFKDTILGFVASIQVSANDMVRVGDWVEMPKYGADGDVISINLNTVKVSNWDKTITTVPTYAFITDSFKNWRGMTETGGRRIKRSIHLKMSSFKFLEDSDLAQFKKYRLIKDYILEKEQEIEEYNKTIDAASTPVNIRRMSNIGVFRIYAENYLKENNRIHKNMTSMVRQLAPTSQGLPLEIYCFSSDIRWIYYEQIMADIFDHLLTIVPEFGLEIFEEPTGGDFAKLTSENL